MVKHTFSAVQCSSQHADVVNWFLMPWVKLQHGCRDFSLTLPSAAWTSLAIFFLSKCSIIRCSHGTFWPFLFIPPYTASLQIKSRSHLDWPLLPSYFSVAVERNFRMSVNVDWSRNMEALSAYHLSYFSAVEGESFHSCYCCSMVIMSNMCCDWGMQISIPLQD